MIELIIERAREHIPTALTTIGGVRPARKTRTIQARYSAEAAQDLQAIQGLNMQVEIAAAIVAQAESEIAYEALTVARESGKLVVQLGPRPDQQLDLAEDFGKEVKAQMATMEAPVVIVSPSLLVMLYMDPDFKRVEHKGHGITQYATLAGRPVIVDPYAAANRPAIVAETGWFEFDYRDLLNAKTSVDKFTGDVTMTFETDVESMVQLDKVRLVEVLQA